MFRGLFITGTDTGVGKTTVAAAVMLRYRHLKTLKYWKPIQTGIETDDDTETVRTLAGCNDTELHLSGIRLPGPVAPYLAAERSGTRIAIADVVRLAVDQSDNTRWVAEGAGGILVPINESESMLDLIAALRMPVLVVARSSLGTINHTLLTIEMLRHRKQQVAGVVMVGQENPANRIAIERFGAVTVVGEMPHFADLSPETLQRWTTSHFDTNGHLQPYFQ